MVEKDVGWSDYYTWLLEIITPKNGEKKSGCGKIVRQLFAIDFSYYIPNDVNRMYDGLDLRNRFKKETEKNLPGNKRPCSVLEVLIALSIALADDEAGYYEKPELAEKWFWKMFENLGLMKFAGRKYEKGTVCTIVERWMHRDFDYNGSGSPFPLKNPTSDQRKDEIWHQVMKYVAENDD